MAIPLADISFHTFKEVIGDRDFSINIISKSGTTTEPAVAFRIFRKMLVDKYGQKDAAKRIYATTDKSKEHLRILQMQKALKKLCCSGQRWRAFLSPYCCRPASDSSKRSKY